MGSAVGGTRHTGNVKVESRGESPLGGGMVEREPSAAAEPWRPLVKASEGSLGKEAEEAPWRRQRKTEVEWRDGHRQVHIDVQIQIYTTHMHMHIHIHMHIHRQIHIDVHTT